MLFKETGDLQIQINITENVYMCRGDFIERYLKNKIRYRHLETTMIYTHVLNHGARAVKSPADRL
ncbi:hypothetical protein DRQ07_08410 [candidate division KSB1 bacterium]|nr:MAG: hypothetical protein DRQ07_08410 [candidate division KSB1 bacterium]